MKVGSLRDCNIVLHLNIAQKRERIPDLPVIYFVEPTPQNFKQIATDASKSLYDYFIINFSTPVSPALMDAFAQEMVRANQTHKVMSVSSEWMGGFQVIAPDFFVLPHHEYASKAK